MPDIYALALGRCAPSGVVRIYQAKHSCLCYNLYIYIYMMCIYIYIYTSYIYIYIHIIYIYIYTSYIYIYIYIYTSYIYIYIYIYTSYIYIYIYTSYIYIYIYTSYIYIYIYIYIYLYPTEAILQRYLQCNKSDIRQVLGNSYLLGSYSPVQCLIW